MWVDALRQYLQSDRWTSELQAFQKEREWKIARIWIC
jgi:hypothetical protein